MPAVTFFFPGTSTLSKEVQVDMRANRDTVLLQKGLVSHPKHNAVNASFPDYHTDTLSFRLFFSYLNSMVLKFSWLGKENPHRLVYGSCEGVGMCCLYICFCVVWTKLGPQLAPLQAMARILLTFLRFLKGISTCSRDAIHWCTGSRSYKTITFSSQHRILLWWKVNVSAPVRLLGTQQYHHQKLVHPPTSKTIVSLSFYRVGLPCLQYLILLGSLKLLMCKTEMRAIIFDTCETEIQ